MASLRWLQMPDEELASFLGNGGTGVLSFSTDPEEPPYSLPVSYGYDDASRNLHFRLALPADGRKFEVADQPVSFVTHESTDEGWHSVVATGKLEELTGMASESAAIQERWAVSIPSVDIFEEPPEEVEFRQFRLVPDDLSGRKEVNSPA